jgi:SAM-dependent methyltransferase
MSDIIPGQDSASDWDEFYAESNPEIQQQIFQSVCGCEYHGSSWMSATEAEELSVLMKLAPGSKLLDIGSGTGWPALFQARSTGAQVTLTDISIEGLKSAEIKASDSGIGNSCQAILSGADKLPFARGHFDAIGHADVLCCLIEKLEVLRECRRVIRNDGNMAFTVIHMCNGATTTDIEEAAAAGPSEIDAPADYPTMLAETGWHIASSRDISSGYDQILQRLLDLYKLNTTEIHSQQGRDRHEELVSGAVTKRDLVARGLVTRSLFTVTPA